MMMNGTRDFSSDLKCSFFVFPSSLNVFRRNEFCLEHYESEKDSLFSRNPSRIGGRDRSRGSAKFQEESKKSIKSSYSQMHSYTLLLRRRI